MGRCALAHRPAFVRCTVDASGGHRAGCRSSASQRSFMPPVLRSPRPFPAWPGSWSRCLARRRSESHCTHTGQGERACHGAGALRPLCCCCLPHPCCSCSTREPASVAAPRRPRTSIACVWCCTMRWTDADAHRVSRISRVPPARCRYASPFAKGRRRARGVRQVIGGAAVGAAVAACGRGRAGRPRGTALASAPASFGTQCHRQALRRRCAARARPRRRRVRRPE